MWYESLEWITCLGTWAGLRYVWKSWVHQHAWRSWAAYQVITEQDDPEFFPPLLISRILAHPCTVCVDRTWKRRRIVLKSCHPSCKLNTHCRIHGHFGTMKMTGTKTGRRINERSLTLIRLKIFGGRIKFIFFVVLYHSCLRYRIIIIIIIAIYLLNGCFVWCSFSLLTFVTNIF